MTTILHPREGFSLKPMTVTLSAFGEDRPRIEGGTNLKRFRGIGELRQEGYDVTQLTGAVYYEVP